MVLENLKLLWASPQDKVSKEAMGAQGTEKEINEEKRKDVRMRKDLEKLLDGEASEESMIYASSFAFASAKRMLDKFWDLKIVVKVWRGHHE